MIIFNSKDEKVVGLIWIIYKFITLYNKSNKMMFLEKGYFR
jgi:hypothetical protein